MTRSVDDAVEQLVRPVLPDDRAARIRRSSLAAFGHAADPWLGLETTNAAVFAVLLLVWGLHGIWRLTA